MSDLNLSSYQFSSVPSHKVGEFVEAEDQEVSTLPDHVPSSINAYVHEELQQLEKASHQPLYSVLSEEEHLAVIEKMQQIVQLPAGHLPRQDELYLEQQLTDMLGFEVSAELEGYRLNHSIGIMESQPHLRRHPTDILVQHDAHREAGIRTTRGGFGWFTELGQLSAQSIQREKYYVAVQASFLEKWHTHPQELKAWLKFRKMIVVNPIEQKAVVGVIGDIGPADWMRRQFGGSPEVIREGLIWSLSTLGRVMLLFINDPSNTIPLGPIDLQYRM